MKPENKEFFQAFIKGREKNEDHVCVISKFDTKGNLCFFMCLRENNQIKKCGGHCPICSQQDCFINSNMDILEFFEIVEFLVNSCFDVVFDFDWFLNSKETN